MNPNDRFDLVFAAVVTTTLVAIALAASGVPVEGYIMAVTGALAGVVLGGGGEVIAEWLNSPAFTYGVEFGAPLGELVIIATGSQLLGGTVLGLTGLGYLGRRRAERGGGR